MRYWQACECAALELESAAYNAGMTLTVFFVNQKKAGRQRTRQVTSLLREEHMSWRPVPGALATGEMLRHMWVSEDGVRKVALDRDFTYYEKRIPGGLAWWLASRERSRRN